MEKRSIIYAAFLIILNSCAVVKSPTGGPQDILAPKIIDETPKNKTLNFKENEFSVSFDEYIQLKNINKELIVSPSLNVKPKVSLKKRTLNVSFSDSLKPNTTYRFSFGKSITDITEGNVLNNYEYVFSTGNYIDSCEISGKLYDAYSLQFEKEKQVLLYDVNCDTCIFYKTPLYFTISDQSGNYNFRNIKNGKYLIYGLEDNNSNVFYDEGEKISFDSNINFENTTILNRDLFLYKEHPTQTIVKQVKCISNYEGLIVLNKPATIESVEFHDLNSNIFSPKVLINKTLDSVWFWVKDVETDSILIDFLLKESDYKIHSIIANPKNCKNKQTAPKITFSPDLYGISQSISFNFTEPIIQLNIQKLMILEDSLNVSQEFELEKVNETNYLLKGKYKPEIKYLIILKDSLFNYFSNQYSDSTGFSFLARNENELGLIKVQIQNNKNNQVVCELINSMGKVIRTETINSITKREIVFCNLIPGKYRLRIISDYNNNFRWDGGSIKKQIKPEPIFYSKEIDLKASWEIEEAQIIID